MKQFMKALDKVEACFAYLSNAFSGLSSEKLKAGVLNGPQVCKLCKGCTFFLNVTKVEQDAWNSYVLVMKGFLGSRRAQNYYESC